MLCVNVILSKDTYMRGKVMGLYAYMHNPKEYEV
jgi:hypothetical protein